MGKKAKTKSGKEKANSRKISKEELPEPPVSVEEEVGSAKLLTESKTPGSAYKALGTDGYDDGGVADLTLVIDLDDSILRRKRGDAGYYSALKADLLPRVTTGQLADVPRKDQKIRLAKLLFSDEDEEDENATPSEVYVDSVDGHEDEATIKKRQDRLKSAKYALGLSSVLREAACASLSLSEISKRYLALKGKEGAEDALRCATKAVEIASDGFYDNDDITIEAEEVPKIHAKYEKNATYHGLRHPTALKYQPRRLADLCLRSGYLHQGNALSARGLDVEAREVYEKVLPMLANEPRCGRLDWERSSVIVNIGNTYSREGDFENANEQYKKAEQLGKDHLQVENGNLVDGMGIMVVAMRARAFALKKAGKEGEAKQRLREVLDLQMKLNVEQKKQRAREKGEQERIEAEEKEMALKEQSNLQDR